jgi:hypothetical protein
LVAAGGRALLSDLQPIINVDMAYLDRAALHITQEVSHISRQEEAGRG